MCDTQHTVSFGLKVSPRDRELHQGKDPVHTVLPHDPTQGPEHLPRVNYNGRIEGTRQLKRDVVVMEPSQGIGRTRCWAALWGDARGSWLGRKTRGPAGTYCIQARVQVRVEALWDWRCWG